MRLYRKEIKDCYQCPHHDHSGGFTPGGAYIICHAMQQPSLEKISNYNGRARVLPHHAIIVNGRSRRRYTREIPKWCPLPKLEE